MALKNEFDKTSYWIVLVRCLTGALLGAIPGVIYLFYTDYHLSNNSFGVALIQMGVLVGTMAFGLAALASTIVAALKSRSTGHVKASRLKEYLNPDTLPAIPPASKPASKSSEQTDVKPVPQTPPPAIEKMQEVMKPVAVQPEQPVFEDFDR